MMNTDIDNQVDYWDGVSDEKEFTHPINIALLKKHLSTGGAILDFGCGYGRVTDELVRAGFANVTGADSSSGMIDRGRRTFPHLKLDVLPPSGIPYPDGSFDAILLVAVLTCIPTDDGQKALIASLSRLLRPQGLLYISDYLLQEDERNRQRYTAHADEFGTYGVFRLPEGAIVRHHPREWFDTLLDGFSILDTATPEVTTMNGHRARAIQILAQRVSA
jgi:SAM-dependent methyltransferase